MSSKRYDGLKFTEGLRKFVAKHWPDLMDWLATQDNLQVSMLTGELRGAIVFPGIRFEQVPHRLLYWFDRGTDHDNPMLIFENSAGAPQPPDFE